MSAWETWYVLEDGTAVSPAMRSHDTPSSRSVEIDEKTGKPLFGGKGDHDNNGSTGGAAPAKRTTEMKPEPASPPKAKKPYKTR